jgi:membrane protein DedA with SNARE-associated domain
VDPASIFRYGTGPAAVFLACMLSGLGIPVPDDFPLLMAGWQIQVGEVALWPTSLAAFAGVFLRDLLAFSIGYWVRRVGHHPRMAFLHRSTRFRQVERLVERFGHRAIWFARFAVGLRVPLYIASGLAGDSYRRMIAINLPWLLLTVPLTIWLGWRYGEASITWLVRHLTQRPIFSSAVLLITLGLLWSAWRLAKSARGRSREREEDLGVDELLQ